MAYAADYEFHLSQFRAHLAGTTSDSLASSFIPPNGHWSSSEKDAFFHGLQVHSRLRPDLIAACIKSKTVVDVCAYIGVLDRAAASSVPLSPLRPMLKAAMEVSDSWVQYEERQSQALLEAQQQWERQAEENYRSELLGRDEVSDAQKQIQEDAWRKKNGLSRLTYHHLKNIESMTTTRPPTVDDTLIDSARSQHVSGRDATPDVELGSMSPISRRRLAKRLYMRKKRAETTGTEADLEPAKLVVGRKKVKGLDSKARPTKYKQRTAGKWVHLAEGGDTRFVTAGPSSIPPQPRQHANESETFSDDHEDLPEARFRGQSGLTAPYKAASDLESRGIDATVLTDAELDIFKVSSLAKLMRKIHNDAASDVKFRTCISFDTIELLRDILLDFITPVVHSAVSLREKEVALKKDITVWRLDKENKITASNVNDALRMYGRANSYVTEEDSDLASDASASDSEGEHGFRRR
ncbi:hypothetical protein C8F01DRAFT_239654 [Mycena amicta]|nr:hypothetical protein C8F01DRAFT_239654 [Mycena amicta]